MLNPEPSDTDRLLARIQLLRAVLDPAVRFIEIQEPHIRDLEKGDQERVRGMMNNFTRALSDIGIVRLSGNGAHGTPATPSDVQLLETRVRQLKRALDAAEAVMNYGAAHIRTYKSGEAQTRAYAQRAAYKTALDAWRAAYGARTQTQEAIR